jgi:hypothetical protein
MKRLLPLLLLLTTPLAAEEVSRAPAAAATKYEDLLARFRDQRALAATATFRLAEVRRKQDRKEQAIVLCQRLPAEFPDAGPGGKLARDRAPWLDALQLTALPAPSHGQRPDALVRRAGLQDIRPISDNETLTELPLEPGDRLVINSNDSSQNRHQRVVLPVPGFPVSRAFERVTSTGMIPGPTSPAPQIGDEHSVVSSRPAIDAAFCSAERVTLVGSTTPALTRSS